MHQDRFNNGVSTKQYKANYNKINWNKPVFKIVGHYGDDTSAETFEVSDGKISVVSYGAYMLKGLTFEEATKKYGDLNVSINGHPSSIYKAE